MIGSDEVIDFARFWRFGGHSWRRLDERIEGLSGEIEALARQDKACERLMTVPGIGPIVSSAIVAAIGTGDAFSKGRDFGA
jgi:transposase